MSTAKTYKVVGPRIVDGHGPGTTYEADYSAEHEQYLIAGGHVEIVKAKGDGDTPAKPDPSSRDSRTSK